METTRTQIFTRINNERDRQDRMYGTQFDDKNTANDWGSYIAAYANSFIVNEELNPREQIEKTMAICCAALEAHERNNGFPPRHYDAG